MSSAGDVQLPCRCVSRFLKVARYHMVLHVCTAYCQLSTSILAKRFQFQLRSCVCCVGMVKEAGRKGCALM